MERIRYLTNYFTSSNKSTSRNSLFKKSTEVNSAALQTVERVELENNGIIDPHHFILIQHGFMGTTADFSGLIRTLMLDHANALSEARSAASNIIHDKNTISSDNNYNNNNNSSCNSNISKSNNPMNGRNKNVLKAIHTTPSNGKLYCSGNRVCFVPGVNNLFGSITGTRSCALKMLEEFLPVFTSWLADVREAEAQRKAAYDHCYLPDNTKMYNEQRCSDSNNSNNNNNNNNTDQNNSASPLSSSSLLPPEPMFCYRTYKPIPVCFSCVGHSFGGVILREFLFLLLTDTTELCATNVNLYNHVKDVREALLRLHVTFENFVTVASPHCGTSECLSPPLYNLAWYISKLQHSKTTQELIHVDAEHVLSERLLDIHHLAALAPFRHRTLFANTTRDFLVGFGTSSLIFEPHVKDQVRIMGIEPDRVPCAAAFKDASAEVSEAIYLPLSSKRYAALQRLQTLSYHRTPYSVGNSLSNSAVIINDNHDNNKNNSNNNNNNNFINTDNKLSYEQYADCQDEFSPNESMTEEERLANHRFFTETSELHELEDATPKHRNTQTYIHAEQEQHYSNMQHKLVNKSRRDTQKLLYDEQIHHREVDAHQNLSGTQIHSLRSNNNNNDDDDNNNNNFDCINVECYNYHHPYSTSLRETRDNIFHENISINEHNLHNNDSHNDDSAVSCAKYKLKKNVVYNASNNCSIINSSSNNNNNNNNNNGSNNVSMNNKDNINRNNNYNNNKYYYTNNAVNNVYSTLPSQQNSVAVRRGIVRRQSNFIGPVESTHTISDIHYFYNVFDSFHRVTSLPASMHSAPYSFSTHSHDYHYENCKSSNNVNSNSNQRNKVQTDELTSTLLNISTSQENVTSASDTKLESLNNNNNCITATQAIRSKRALTNKLQEEEEEEEQHLSSNKKNVNINDHRKDEYDDKEEAESISDAKLSLLCTDNDTFINNNSNNNSNNDNDATCFTDENDKVEEPILNCDEPSFAFTLSNMSEVFHDNSDNEDSKLINNAGNVNCNANNFSTSCSTTITNKKEEISKRSEGKSSVQRFLTLEQLVNETNVGKENNTSVGSNNKNVDALKKRRASNEESDVQSLLFHEALEMYDDSENENITASITTPNNNNNINDYYNDAKRTMSLEENNANIKIAKHHCSSLPLVFDNESVEDKTSLSLAVTNKNGNNSNEDGKVIPEVNWPALPAVTIIGSPRKRNCEELPLELVWQNTNKELHEQAKLLQNGVPHHNAPNATMTNRTSNKEILEEQNNKSSVNTHNESLLESSPVSLHLDWQLITHPLHSSWSVLEWIHHKLMQFYALRYPNLWSNINTCNRTNSSSTVESNDTTSNNYNKELKQSTVSRIADSHSQSNSDDREQYNTSYSNNALSSDVYKKTVKCKTLHESDANIPHTSTQLPHTTTEVCNNNNNNTSSQLATHSFTAVEFTSSQNNSPSTVKDKHKQHRDSSICFSKREYALLPRSSALPRLIAETLRRHLDWRVRAIRYANAIPMAHIACLGTYDWLGASLAIVQAVSEEVATVLCERGYCTFFFSAIRIKC